MTTFCWVLEKYTLKAAAVTLVIKKKEYRVTVLSYKGHYFWKALGKEGEEDTLDKALASARNWIENKQ